MRSPNCLVLLAVLVSTLLMACSDTTMTEEAQSSNDPKVEATATPSAEPSKGQSQPIQIAPQLINGWPADTPDLRDVIFKFKVTGDRKRALRDDDSGFLIIQSEQTAEAAKLLFYDGRKSSYRLPARRFHIHTIGPDLICRNASFWVPGRREDQVEFEVEIFGLESGALMSFKNSSGKSSGNISSCRPQSVWAMLDAADERSASAKKNGQPRGKQVAAGAAVGAGAAALVLMKVLVTIAAMPVMLGGGGQ